MSDAIIVAIVSGGLTLLGTIITVLVSHKVAEEKIHGEINVIKNDIKTLSDRVEAHNKVVERTYALEARAAAVDAKLNAMERSGHHED